MKEKGILLFLKKKNQYRLRLRIRPPAPSVRNEKRIAPPGATAIKSLLLFFLQKKKNFLFFSEEKNQKTFYFSAMPTIMDWAGGACVERLFATANAVVRQLRNKSLFASFSSEKEDSFLSLAKPRRLAQRYPDP